MSLWKLRKTQVYLIRLWVGCQNKVYSVCCCCPWLLENTAGKTKLSEIKEYTDFQVLKWYSSSSSSTTNLGLLGVLGCWGGKVVCVFFCFQGLLRSFFFSHLRLHFLKLASFGPILKMRIINDWSILHKINISSFR